MSTQQPQPREHHDPAPGAEFGIILLLLVSVIVVTTVMR